MPWTIERLRWAIVAVAVVLLISIAGFFFYARWRVRHITQDLPAHLGLQIQQSTHGFVLSKTELGRTVFTLHAARAVAFKSGGRVLLHDVKIDLYNQDGQADTIAGKDFQYDRNNQIVESQDEAHIRLHTPKSETAGAANKNASQVVQITTHGLVFNQKSGVATCSGEVDFQLTGSSGQAIGAVYDSKQGHLLLQSQVVMRTEMQHRPAILHATQAVYARADGQVQLEQPQYSSTTPQGEERGSAIHATVFLRPDGSAEKVDAAGAVKLTSADGATVQSSTMHALLSPNNRPEHMHFVGNVKFAQQQPGQQATGSAQDALVNFDAQGQTQRAIFNQDVHFRQQLLAGKDHLLRTLRAQHLDLHMKPVKAGQAELQSALATGNAVFRSQTTTGSHASQETQISAQTLAASFVAGSQIRHIDGTDQTEVRSVALNGDVDTSTGDTLSADFVPIATGNFASHSSPGVPSQRVVASRTVSAAKGADAMPMQSIRQAVQTGHVILRQTSSPKTGTSTAPQVSTATAKRAEYQASDDTLMLTGSPVFRDTQIELAADTMQVHRATGKVIATGAVLGTLISGGPLQFQAHGSAGGGNVPVHVIAAQAIVMQAQQNAIFTGKARLWQGGNTLEAPVIELSQKMQVLLAHGDGPCAQCVHSTFVNQPGSVAPNSRTKAQGARPAGTAPRSESTSASKPGAALPDVFRVLSQRLLYSDAERKATYTQDVEVDSENYRLLANEAEIYLSAAPIDISAQKNTASASNKAPQTSVQRIVATGNVRLIQPGRHATGGHLVYTADDGNFVLTGADGKHPKVFDVEHGMVTGPVLTFASQQQEIIVSGTVAQPTSTETRMKKR